MIDTLLNRVFAVEFNRCSFFSKPASSLEHPSRDMYSHARF